MSWELALSNEIVLIQEEVNNSGNDSAVESQTEFCWASCSVARGHVERGSEGVGQLKGGGPRQSDVCQAGDQRVLQLAVSEANERVHMICAEK